MLKGVPLPFLPAHRLYVPDRLTPGASLELDSERFRYAGRVLRLRAGDEVVLFDGTGGEFTAAITEVSRRAIVLGIGAHRERNVESPVEINLVQGVSRGERMDLVVQKATELGVQRITPVLTERSVVRLHGDRSERRREHWEKVAQSACEQCGRNIVPVIDEPQPFAIWLASAGASDAQRAVLRPGVEQTLSGLPASKRWQLLIGPEGGLAKAELEQATEAGFAPCALGPRVLRTETAAIAALVILQDRFGDLG
jgi:16S rRNA (uracil1498-N3)-methyltransferase